MRHSRVSPLCYSIIGGLRTILRVLLFHLARSTHGGADVRDAGGEKHDLAGERADTMSLVSGQDGVRLAQAVTIKEER